MKNIVLTNKENTFTLDVSRAHRGPRFTTRHPKGASDAPFVRVFSCTNGRRSRFPKGSQAQYTPLGVAFGRSGSASVCHQASLQHGGRLHLKEPMHEKPSQLYRIAHGHSNGLQPRFYAPTACTIILDQVAYTVRRCDLPPSAEGDIAMKAKIIAFPGCKRPRNRMTPYNREIIAAYFDLPEDDQRAVAKDILGRLCINSLRSKK